MIDIEEEYQKILNKIPLKGESSKISQKITDSVMNILKEIKSGSKVIIRGAGNHTKNLLKLIELHKEEINFNILAIVDDKEAGEELSGIKICTRIDSNDIEFDAVIIFSYFFSEEMRFDYEVRPVKIVDIYEELELRGLELQRPAFDYIRGGYEIPIFYLEQLKKERIKENFEYVIDSVLEIRDFISAEKYIKEYIDEGYDTNNTYNIVLQDIKILLKKIEMECKSRSQKDILMFWTDAVPYEKIEWLPGIFSLKGKSCFFTHSYTNTPFTHSTARSLLKGKLPIDDFSTAEELISEKNSNVIEYLNEKEYLFKHLGGGMEKILSPEYNIKKMGNLECFINISAPVIIWTAIREMILSSKPVFFLIHSIAETHSPYISLAYKDKKYYLVEGAYRYLDKQIMFYKGLLGEKSIKIFMSDHGEHIIFPAYYFKELKIHTYFMVNGNGIDSQVVDKIFSYKNFDCIVKWLVESDTKFIDDAFTEYSLIQDTDIYNKQLINHFVGFDGEEYARAYRGVVTLKDKYALISGGKEFYYLLPNEKDNLINCSEYAERIEELREITGNNFLDIYKNERFRYSRVLYELKNSSINKDLKKNEEKHYNITQ